MTNNVYQSFVYRNNWLLYRQIEWWNHIIHFYFDGIGEYQFKKVKRQGQMMDVLTFLWYIEEYVKGKGVSKLDKTLTRLKKQE